MRDRDERTFCDDENCVRSQKWSLWNLGKKRFDRKHLARHVQWNEWMVHPIVDLRLRHRRRHVQWTVHPIVDHITPTRRGAATKMSITAAHTTIASTTSHTATVLSTAKTTTVPVHLAASATAAGVHHHPTQCTAAAAHPAHDHTRNHTLRTHTQPHNTKKFASTTTPRSRLHTGQRR